MNILIVAEKPSVARDIARAVGATKSNDGYLEGNQYKVSWAIGHLVTLPQPHEINPEWKAWKKETLPMLPSSWPLSVIEKTKGQFQILKKLMNSCDGIICATDAGREGELIFRYIYEAANCKKPVKRLWISSLTQDAIKDGLKNLKDAKHFDALGDAARARSCADWLTGINLSRAYAITHHEQYFVGRVQTPTLAMIVKRELEIKNFKPEKYLEIQAEFDTQGNVQDQSIYQGIYFYLNDHGDEEQRLPHDEILAKQVIARVKQGKAKIRSIESKEIAQQPPLLYDLTELQRHANRIFGYSAAKTLEVAQALYEKHKALSYPRTGSQHLSQSVAGTLSKVITAIRKTYENLILPETGETLLNSRYVNDQKVTDHHAIIPTGLSIERLSLSDEEKSIYDLVCRRLLSCWQKDYVTSVTHVVTEVESKESGKAITDLFRSKGTVVQELGWKRLELGSQSDRSDLEEENERLPLGLKSHQSVIVKGVQSLSKSTKAPSRLTEAALLSAMESAGRRLEDKELASHMRDSGLGTPATRAGIIETLLTRGYIERKGKSLIPTALGIQLIEIVHPSMKSPELTARWEKSLAEIEAGKQNSQEFIEQLKADVSKKIQEIFSSPIPVKNLTDQNSISLCILKQLSSNGAKAAGKLFEEVSKELKGDIERREFEQVVDSLSAAGKIKVQQESFEKDGKAISYRRVCLAS